MKRFPVVVEIEDADGELIHSYVIDYDNPDQRRVFGEQSNNALRAGQSVITYPED